MAKTQRQVLCHCLRVGVASLLRPLRSTTTKGVSGQVRERRVEQSCALLSVVSASVDTESRGPGARQPGLRKLRFDRWCIWGLSSQMRGVAVPGWAHWLTLAHCLGSSPPHHTWVLRHIGNGVISSRSVGLLDVRFSILHDHAEIDRRRRSPRSTSANATCRALLFGTLEQRAVRPRISIQPAC